MRKRVVEARASDFEDDSRVMGQQLSFMGEIDRHEIRAYLRTVHSNGRNNRGNIIWAEKRSEKRFFQHAYRFDDILYHVRKISSQNRKDTYISLQSFVGVKRNIEQLWQVGTLGFDIDCHNVDMPSMVAQGYWQAIKTQFADDGFSMPSVAVLTGRGLQLVYCIDPMFPDPKKMALWRVMGEAIAEKLRSILGVDAELDENYADLARVFRLAGTYNTKAHDYAQLVYCDELARYRLGDLRDKHFPELCILPGKSKSEKRVGAFDKEPSERLRFLNIWCELHAMRLFDIIKLRELRKEQDIPEDHRRRMVFLYRYYSCFYYGKDTALEATLVFNAEFRIPLPVSVVEKDTRSAEKAFDAHLGDYRKGYNYRNSTLITFFGITECEQKELRTIISKEEKARRRAEVKRWGNEKRDDRRFTEKIERDKKIKAMLDDGHTYNSICTELKVSRKSVSKIKYEQLSIKANDNMAR